MIRNYLKIALRHALKSKTFSLVNLLGLSIGLAAAMATMLFVKKELSYDTFQRHYERIYQVGLDVSFDGKNFERWSQAPNKVGPYLKANMPEVQEQARILHHQYGKLAFVSSGVKHLTESKLYYADPGILEIFDFNFVEGRPQMALSRPNTAIIRRATAERYFGSASPIGKTLRIDNELEVEITGVFGEFEGDTHLDYDILASFDTMQWAARPEGQSWSNASFETFLLLKPNTNPEAFAQKIEAVVAKESPRKERFFSIFLRPLSDVYLHSAAFTNKINAPYGNAQQTNILIALTIALLLIAAINYMNLSTARLQRNFREVGINKVLGANVRQMMQRFYSETFLFVTIALLISIVLLSLCLPLLNDLTGEHLQLTFLSEGWFWLALITIWVLLVLLSGAYPALTFARHSPKFLIQAATHQPKTARSLFRQGLVVFQFTASIVLIVTVVVFRAQLNYLQHKKLGFKPEQVVGVMVNSLKQKAEFDALENEFKQIAAVGQVSYTQSFPGLSTSLRTLPNPKNPHEGANLYTTRTRPEIIETLGIKLLAGTTVPKKQASDTTVQVVINKTAADYLGLSPAQALGKKLRLFSEYSNDEIVGVVEDFHFQSMHEKIVPFAFHNARTETYSYLMVRLNTSDLLGSMELLERRFKKVMPNSAFEYVFMDQHLANLYSAEKRSSSIITLFASLAILVACLGLFGLATFSAEARTKEIGIRKVLGASVLSIVGLLTQDFLRLVMLAIVIASPLAYYFVEGWLQGFAYRIPVSGWYFVLAGVAVSLVAFLTVGYQSLRAAWTNPVKSLKTE